MKLTLSLMTGALNVGCMSGAMTRTTSIVTSPFVLYNWRCPLLPVPGGTISIWECPVNWILSSSIPGVLVLFACEIVTWRFPDFISCSGSVLLGMWMWYVISCWWSPSSSEFVTHRKSRFVLCCASGAAWTSTGVIRQWTVWSSVGSWMTCLRPRYTRKMEEQRREKACCHKTEKYSSPYLTTWP